MVPSTDWPERKEPPEFSNPPRASNKSKPVKEHSQQYHAASGEGRKVHAFAQVYKIITDSNIFSNNLISNYSCISFSYS